MRFIIVLASLVTVILAQQHYQQQYPYSPPIPIIRLENVVSPDGSFTYSYETANGIQAHEQGYLQDAGNPQLEGQAVQGSYAFRAPDNVVYRVDYTADRNGFVARGAHLPTPPPIPQELQRAYEEAARNSDPNDDGQYDPRRYGRK